MQTICKTPTTTTTTTPTITTTTTINEDEPTRTLTYLRRKMMEKEEERPIQQYTNTPTQQYNNTPTAPYMYIPLNPCIYICIYFINYVNEASVLKVLSKQKLQQIGKRQQHTNTNTNTTKHTHTQTQQSRQAITVHKTSILIYTLYTIIIQQHIVELLKFIPRSKLVFFFDDTGRVLVDRCEEMLGYDRYIPFFG